MISDDARTSNALRLARWALPALVLVVGILATAVVLLSIVSPLAAAGLLGGGSAGGALAARRRSR
ncbi:hypothetical protein [Amycolatopsis sp. NPDC051071]|uniref:hypothetical protein n=1 Tax=Amycolatopsis sp. NPDC051071 TaxID=3154637 RepID=UPI003443361E